MTRRTRRTERRRRRRRKKKKKKRGEMIRIRKRKYNSGKSKEIF